MHRQHLTGLEQQPLCAGAELHEVGYSARLTADLDYVAALDAARGDFDVRREFAAGGPHPFACWSSEASSAVWQEQAHAS
ncbi:hypothetical protein ACIA8H_03585 [Streptomyces goshikiensis]|uniref:hypothetical protein n=1 Tax=Streptomyces goshikiensis TaxID=1942 RepID=UPI0037BBA6C9